MWDKQQFLSLRGRNCHKTAGRQPHWGDCNLSMAQQQVHPKRQATTPSTIIFSHFAAKIYDRRSRHIKSIKQTESTTKHKLVANILFFRQMVVLAEWQ